MHRNSDDVSTKQERIAALAKQSPEMAFTSLAYLMDIDWLKEAYRRTRKGGAVGEVARTLCVLRSDGELGIVDTVSPRGRAALAKVA